MTINLDACRLEPAATYPARTFFASFRCASVRAEARIAIERSGARCRSDARRNRLRLGLLLQSAALGAVAGSCAELA